VPGLELAVWDMAGPPERADEVRAVVPPYMGASRVIHNITTVPGVELVQLLTAGYEEVQHVLPEGVALANAAGVHDASTAFMPRAVRLLQEQLGAYAAGRPLRNIVTAR
jgi:hypothetical protein